MATTTTAPTNFAEAEAVLASKLPAYTVRPTQQRGAQAVEEAFGNQEHLLLKAGTGTGKSLLLLIPAILSGERTVVSTATKALQSQYAEKDLPFLSEHLGVSFRWAMLQGRSNYFCSNRAALVADDSLVTRMMSVAQEPNFSGLRDDFPFEVPSQVWGQVCGDAEECDALECKTRGGCYVHIARALASDAQVVLVNHALLAMDCVADAALLGAYTQVIVDEVHELADYAAGAFESRFTEGAVRMLIARARNLVDGLYGEETQAKVAEVLSGLVEANVLFWSAMTLQMPEKDSTLRITSDVLVRSADEWATMAQALHAVAGAVASLPAPVSEADIKRLRILKRRASLMADRFSAMVSDDFAASVRWLAWETTAKGDRRLVVTSRPLEVGPFLQQSLFEGRCVVGASATIDFSFTSEQLGLAQGNFTGLDVGSNFDYKAQALTYIPDIPAPSGRTAAQWEAEVPAQILKLLQASQGRALLLFTSVRQMERVHGLIARSLPWKVLRQGQMPQAKLLEAFKGDVHSVLFATKSWFTGVDVSGEALSLVVLDKLPFPNPTEPVFEALSEVFDKRFARDGGSFRHLSIPVTTMTLEQAFGRLIRTSTDRGVFACLDSRLLRTWGQPIAKRLPAPQTSSLDAVQRFFA